VETVSGFFIPMKTSNVTEPVQQFSVLTTLQGYWKQIEELKNVF
jgi:hypothetical protein